MSATLYETPARPREVIDRRLFVPNTAQPPPMNSLCFDAAGRGRLPGPSFARPVRDACRIDGHITPRSSSTNSARSSLTDTTRSSSARGRAAAAKDLDAEWHYSCFADAARKSRASSPWAQREVAPTAARRPPPPVVIRDRPSTPTAVREQQERCVRMARPRGVAENFSRSTSTKPAFH